ncbi:response regulator transcription factor [Burkholderia sp. JSH-S8]|nr:response regulator transcription factor [Burkholderia sp. JSH-S8]
MNILLLTEDRKSSDSLAVALLNQGHQISVSSFKSNIIRSLEREFFDIVMLRALTASQQLFHTVKAIGLRLSSQISIFVIIDMAPEDAVVSLFQVGADECCAGQFREQEVLARIEALYRRSHVNDVRLRIEIGRFIADRNMEVIFFNDSALNLTSLETSIALLLFENFNKTVSRDFFMRAVWGQGAISTSRSLDSHICKLRRKLFAHPSCEMRLRNVYGYGYRLESTQ